VKGFSKLLGQEFALKPGKMIGQEFEIKWVFLGDFLGVAAAESPWNPCPAWIYP
jgi:hypothetical protein